LIVRATTILYRISSTEAGDQMGSFIAACVAVVAIAVLGAVALNYMQEPASAAFTTPGAHL
jgi:hypothetical protein